VLKEKTASWFAAQQTVRPKRSAEVAKVRCRAARRGAVHGQRRRRPAWITTLGRDWTKRGSATA